MTITDRDSDDRRDGARRRGDEFRAWLPMLVSLAMTILSLGVLYGSLTGRLALIEYRLTQIEVHTR